jgi:hypothetical protein
LIPIFVYIIVEGKVAEFHIDEVEKVTLAAKKTQPPMVHNLDYVRVSASRVCLIQLVLEPPLQCPRLLQDPKGG